MIETTTTPVSNRIQYIDIARGIGILLVVLGHNDFSIISPFAYHVIYSFHMPLFFFLSGYFINTSDGFRTFAVKRFHSLLKPYLFTIFLIYTGSISFGRIGFQNALGRIVKSLYASGIYIDWVQLWFLPHLFVVALYAFCFYKLFERSGCLIKWLILVATLGLASLIGQRFYPFPLTVSGKEYTLYGLPFSLDLIFLSGFFYILGGEMHQAMEKQTLENPLLCFISGAAVLLLNYFFGARIDFNTRVYESLLINTTEAILGILFILALSRQIDLRIRRLASWFTYFGRVSLIILIFHVPIQEFWGQKISAVTDNPSFPVWGGFIMSVAISALIYELFIRANPVASWWFGLKADGQENKTTVTGT